MNGCNCKWSSAKFCATNIAFWEYEGWCLIGSTFHHDTMNMLDVSIGFILFAAAPSRQFPWVKCTEKWSILTWINIRRIRFSSADALKNGNGTWIARSGTGREHRQSLWSKLHCTTQMFTREEFHTKCCSFVRKHKKLWLEMASTSRHLIQELPLKSLRSQTDCKNNSKI